MRKHETKKKARVGKGEVKDPPPLKLHPTEKTAKKKTKKTYYK